MSHKPETLKHAIKRMEKIRDQRNAAYDVMDNAIGCFTAAEAEGLTQALAETTDTRLKDLIERRVLHAWYELESLEQVRRD